MEQHHEVVFSLLGEGGSLAISRVDNSTTPTFYYHHNETGWDETEDVQRVTKYRSFIEAFAQIDSRYPWHRLFPKWIHIDYYDLVRSALLYLLNRRRETAAISYSLRQYENLLGIRLQVHNGQWTYLAEYSLAPVRPLTIEPVSARLEGWHHELVSLWKNQELSAIVPMIYPEPVPNSLLYVGINPSYNAQDIRNVLKRTDYANQFATDQAVDDFFRFDLGIVSERIPDLQAIQRLHHDKLPYFARHRKTADLLGMGWEQADLFQLRKSKQDEFTQLITQPPYVGFAKEQLRLFFALLEIQQPRIIIAANGAVTKFFRGRSPEYNPLAPDFYIQPTDLPNVVILSHNTLTVPVILSSQFTHYMSPERKSTKIEQEVALVWAFLGQ
ncbi:hypothetical protein F5984_23665 [Rudanella paleaurantiibacter]|uniref:Uncharacterized protein n=1 Tax=Rudanella paleaurantiibacter TaxID=2614655 RepID=A0A7J5TSV8_9BACT|nr:hypothetical protein [Rudanella paleaurantiibacter]KAB7726628.1 hypothetical protein F5984_23665 [Rudanella paleaurantiibacter]